MAVFTQISESDLRELISKYDIGELESFSGISEGIQNSNYIVKTSSAKYILTLFEDERIFNSLPFFFNFKEHLVGSGVPCPAPIHDKNDSMFNEICGRQASFISFLPGKWPRSIKKEHCEEIGKYSALMHKAAESFPENRDDPQADMLLSYKKLQEESADLESFKSGIVAEIEKAADYIKSNCPSDLPSGVIHGDIFPDNVLFEDDRLTGIIDFYFSHTGFYVYDLANTLTQWCFEHGAEFNITKSRSLLSAYNKERKLSGDELNALPILASASAMTWFLSRLYSWFNPAEGAMVNQKDPLEQLEKLRFHLQVKSVSDYGLDL